MAVPSTTNAGLASDTTSINALRSTASRDPKVDSAAWALDQMLKCRTPGTWTTA